MGIYRRSNILERLLSLSASPTIPDASFQKVVDLLMRCTYVDGSTTLITRCSLVAWIASSFTCKEGQIRGRLKDLATRVYATSDQARIDKWSDGDFASVLQRLEERKMN